MAIEIRFNCNTDPEDFLTVNSYEDSVIIEGLYQGVVIAYEFDIPTAIKLSKTIRTHINIVKGI